MEIYFQSASLFVLHGDSRARAGAKRMRVARSVRPQHPKNNRPQLEKSHPSCYPEYQFNLSDFTFILSVIKNKRTYKCTLSIILGKEIDLETVKVEQVILNKPKKETKYKHLPSPIITFITQE